MSHTEQKPDTMTMKEQIQAECERAGVPIAGWEHDSKLDTEIARIQGEWTTAAPGEFWGENETGTLCAAFLYSEKQQPGEVRFFFRPPDTEGLGWPAMPYSEVVPA